MATTANELLPYPGQGQEPDSAGDIQKLAEAADARLAELRAKFVRPFGHMGITAGFSAPGNGGRAPMDAAQILRGGMTFDNAQDALGVPVNGLYTIRGQAYASGAGWGTQITTVYVKPASGAAEYQTGINVRAYRESTNGPPDTCYPFAGTLDLKAGDKVYLVNFYTGQTNTWGTSGFNGTYLEVEFSQV